LIFASQAAASMALATLTGCTDSGYILQDMLAPHVTLQQLQNASLHWAKASDFLHEKRRTESKVSTSPY